MRNVMTSAFMLAALTVGMSSGWAASLDPKEGALITGRVDESKLATLQNEHPLALHRGAVDKGPLAADHSLTHVMMALKRSPERQAAFDQLLKDQQDPKSARYHAWLTPADLRQYGPAQADIDKVTAWLSGHGLNVNRVSPSGMSIDFAGTAGRIGEAFHTELHQAKWGDEAHIANVRDPAIPEALSPVIAGVTLSNFFPKSNAIPAKPNFTLPTPYGTFYAVVPNDFNTIYNVNPLLNGTSLFGIRVGGAGSTIAVVEQTDILTADWNTFRSTFGLSSAAGTYSTEHPGGCADPGYTGDEIEAAIDAEYASAPAPDAAIIEASCAGTETSFGVETTLQNLVEINTTAQILSISYGGCELGNGLSFLTGWNDLIEEGASEGLSIFVSSGDHGSSCDGRSIAEDGIGVNGLASNSYDTAVGGTDFLDSYLGQIPTYWTKTNSTPGYGSALSYIPETPWDNSCASNVLAALAHAASTEAFCNAASTKVGTQNGVGGAGGQSVYITKPDWQSLAVPGVPNDGVRDLPDISLFAANGIFGHFYLICMSDTNEGGAPCDYSNYNDALDLAYGGTSVSTPAFAGITALLTQDYGRRIGNVAPRLYQLAQLQFTNGVLATKCNATLGNKISPACVFNNVTVGTNDEPCVAGTPNCGSAYPIGVLNTVVGRSVVDTWPAHQGYSLATGLGSVNVTNLLYSY